MSNAWFAITIFQSDIEKVVDYAFNHPTAAGAF
jgi:hypothetical protein